MKKIIPFATQHISCESDDPISFCNLGPLSQVELDFKLAGVVNDATYLRQEYCNFRLLKIDVFRPLVDSGLAEIAKMLAGEDEEQALIEVDPAIVLFLCNGEEVL